MPRAEPPLSPMSPRPLLLNMAAERDVYFPVLEGPTDVRPRVHELGPQGPIDEDLPVEKCDIVVESSEAVRHTHAGDGWRDRTEHEIRLAIAAWRKSRKPEVVMCFNDAPYKPEGLGGEAGHPGHGVP